MKTWTKFLFGATALTSLGLAAPALAADLDQQVAFSIAPGNLDDALMAYSAQSDLQVISASNTLRGKRTAGVSGEATPREALAMLLKDSGLSYVATSPSTVTVTQGEGGSPQSGSAAGGGAEVEALIVTAQKKEEDIQDVPIAISAFSQKTLDAQKIEGGFDLLKAIPNVTFSKNNFTSYNFSIRGVGTKALSAATDPGVAVSFNNTSIIQNRLFEQEYYDLERVEVLRGPQGTLYGRNATSGVINVISAKADLDEFEGYIKAEAGNYKAKRVQGMINVPILEEKLAVRLAGAMTSREGYDFNSVTDHQVNGRELWSTRLTVGFEPMEALRGNFIWEHFEEDDNRSRTGKQLCHRDDGPETIGATSVVGTMRQGQNPLVRRAFFAQGCKAGSLYDDGAFGTPNGLSYNFILGLISTKNSGFNIGVYRNGPFTEFAQVIDDVDPYGGLTQSRNLREIASFRDPVYRAKADIIELNAEFDVTDGLTFYSQTAYVEDETYSFQDYNRFVTLPVFTDTSEVEDYFGGPSRYANLAPRPAGSPVGTPGVFCDPQLGCTDTIAGFDIAQGRAEQFSQEFRLQSAWDGPINFSLGANYTRFETSIDYYVMFNLLTAMAMTPLFDENPDPDICTNGWAWNGQGSIDAFDADAHCPYIDPQAVDTSKNFEGDGHNYFRSSNPYELESTAVFGEVYWNLREDLKLTGGLRYTDDQKTFTQVPSQVLLASGFLGGGTVARGYPVAGVIDQEWKEWTGRLVLDWKPDLSFTDDTLLYASLSHGYKGGGANPPKPGFATEAYLHDYIVGREILSETDYQMFKDQGFFPVLQLTADEYSDTFEPEFVDALEFGAKNTVLGGALTINTTAFYYDYKDYQVSQIRDRTAVNENFDATVWGLEFESIFSPTRNLQFIANVGYLDTKIADGETSIDIMDRTQSNPDYVLVKPWAQLPSNCVVPRHIAEFWLNNESAYYGYYQMCGGLGGFLAIASAPFIIDENTGVPYTPVAEDANGNRIYPELNGGAGLLADLGGNELPNAPHWTTNLGAQYSFGTDAWKLTLRGDVYWQSQSWHRVYNSDPYDKLHGWYNANLAVWLEFPDHDLKVELYAKNILDETPITDAFLNSDDTGLTTNVFTLDPRLIGLSVRKEF
jgi:iron complex outermembrane receptor protein